MEPSIGPLPRGRLVISPVPDGPITPSSSVVRFERLASGDAGQRDDHFDDGRKPFQQGDAALAIPIPMVLTAGVKPTGHRYDRTFVPVMVNRMNIISGIAARYGAGATRHIPIVMTTGRSS